MAQATKTATKTATLPKAAATLAPAQPMGTLPAPSAVPLVPIAPAVWQAAHSSQAQGATCFNAWGVPQPPTTLPLKLGTVAPRGSANKGATGGHRYAHQTALVLAVSKLGSAATVGAVLAWCKVNAPQVTGLNQGAVRCALQQGVLASF